MLSTAYPDRNVTFRNLGWSADTPDGDSRNGLSLLQAGYEPDGEGWRQLVKQIELTKPTVVIFGYGMASSLEGGLQGVDAFTKDFGRLIETIEQGLSQKLALFSCLPSAVSTDIRTTKRSHRTPNQSNRSLKVTTARLLTCQISLRQKSNAETRFT